MGTARYGAKAGSRRLARGLNAGARRRLRHAARIARSSLDSRMVRLWLFYMLLGGILSASLLLAQ